jgi:arsenite methyltransferase
MAITCPVGFQVDQLREQIRAEYDRLARTPQADFHFHRGIGYAVGHLRYARAELEALPSSSVERFAGVGNPLRIGPIFPGETVLDHACGAGVDLLLAARKVGLSGRAIGVDMTPAMRDQANFAATAGGLAAVVEVRAGLFEDLPVESASVDVVISNGVVNLSPEKRRVFAEVARVLKPGGRLYLADVVVARELKKEARENPELWVACIGGALQEEELIELSTEVGLRGGKIVERFDAFAGTTAQARVAIDLRVQGASFYAEKPRA